MSYQIGTKFTYTSPESKKYSAEVLENGVVKTIQTPGTRAKKEYNSVQEWMKSISETLTTDNSSFIIKEPKGKKTKQEPVAEKVYGKFVMDNLTPSVKKLAIIIYEVIEEGNKGLVLNDEIAEAFNDFISYINQNIADVYISSANSKYKYTNFRLFNFERIKTRYVNLGHHFYHYGQNNNTRKLELETNINTKFIRLYTLVYSHISTFLEEKMKVAENNRKIPILKRAIKHITNKISEQQELLVSYQQELDDILNSL